MASANGGNQTCSSLKETIHPNPPKTGYMPALNLHHDEKEHRSTKLIIVRSATIGNRQSSSDAGNCVPQNGTYVAATRRTIIPWSTF